MSRMLIILGNGFTIDFINQIGKDSEIDVRNLFRLGHTVRFPDTDIPGFLSYKHCPALWILGARPNKSSEENMSIIEEIITCSNMLFEYLNLPYKKNERRLKLVDQNNQSMYIKAYSELIPYLKHLFVEYDQKISDSELREFVTTAHWGWVEFFRSVIMNDKYDEIDIITYNYDVWLERLLSALGIQYSICGCENQSCSLKIIKPHGSISFVPRNSKKVLYNINYEIDSEGVDIGQIEIQYADLDQYDKSFLIPPTGDSFRRSPDTWAAKLRECARDAVISLEDNDDVIICGMSYWHADRKELDELLINLNQNVNITLINPNPPKDLNAVLVSLFQKYTVYTSAETMREIVV